MLVRTLLVGGDEPMDIVFGGENNSRAFITTAHRGQNSPVDPQATTPGVGRADVWVFDTAALAADAGTPLNIITCVPTGSGMRIALDRDEDGALDGDEITAGTNPADAASVPVI